MIASGVGVTRYRRLEFYMCILIYLLCEEFGYFMIPIFIGVRK